MWNILDSSASNQVEDPHSLHSVKFRVYQLQLRTTKIMSNAQKNQNHLQSLATAALAFCVFAISAWAAVMADVTAGLVLHCEGQNASCEST